MNHHVQVFEVDATAGSRATAKIGASFAVTADTVDEARALVEKRLSGGGQIVRSLSLLKDGGLAAVIEKATPAPRQVERAQRMLRQRGAR